jgi:soluble lytic murein transglycosylase-like protein
MMRHSLFASVVVVCVVPLLSAPALAAGHGHRHRARALPMQEATIGQGVYDYAPAFGAPQDRRDAWQQSKWQQSNWSQTRFDSSGFNQYGALDGMAAAQAGANGVPVSLVERVIKRESGGNPGAVSRGNYGLMQIRLGTARAMGFSGSAAELLDPQVNMTYAVRYLAGAYRAAGGNENRAVALYASGYYYQAKAQGFSPYAAQEASGFAGYQPGGFQYAETFGNTTPVYRARHYRHRPV